MRIAKYLLIDLAINLFIGIQYTQFNIISKQDPIPAWSYIIASIVTGLILIFHYHRDRRIFK